MKINYYNLDYNSLFFIKKYMKKTMLVFAFTLIELIVMITILAILWTIAFIFLRPSQLIECKPGMTEITLSNGQTWSCMNLWATTVRDETQFL